MNKIFEGKRILVTGGTGSLGKILVKRILSGVAGIPKKVIVFSRDEAKQHYMRMDYLQRRVATDEIIYHNFERTLEFVIGDIRDLQSVISVCRQADIIFNAAALKQVPSCEYFPMEAVRTNIEGPQNIVQAIRDFQLPVQTVVGISTDKACKPVNVMGMTKAIQERIFISANLLCPNTRFVGARYGNVLASRGSVIPLFHDQIRSGGPVTITSPDMTRFLLSLEQAVDTIMSAVTYAKRGEIFVPRVLAAKVMDIAKILIGNRNIETRITGIRPGEKVHESLISEEEAARTVWRGDCYAIRPMLSEIDESSNESAALVGEFSSDKFIMNEAQAIDVLSSNRLLLENSPTHSDEILR